MNSEITQAQAMVAGAETLSELCDALNAIHVAGDTTSYTKMEDLGVDMTSLPVYGGDEPSDTREIWSWDATHLLVSGEGGRFTLTPRN